MLCSICQKNPATIHIQEISGNEKKVLHLCQECAEKKAREDSMFKEFNLAEVLFQLSGQIENQIKKDSPDSEPAATPEQAKIFCKTCGWDYESSKKTGLMGCPDCYGAFQDVLKSAIGAMHRGTVHLGKKPMEPKSARMVEKPKASRALLKMNIKRLQGELETAVAEERYEEAAGFRDRIGELKKELEDTPDGN